MFRLDAHLSYGFQCCSAFTKVIHVRLHLERWSKSTNLKLHMFFSPQMLNVWYIYIWQFFMVDVGKYTIHWVFGDRLMPTNHVNDHVSCFGRAILPAHVECRYFESWKPIVSVECPFKWWWWRMDMHVCTHNMCVFLNKYIYIHIYLVLFHSPSSDDESRILCESLCDFTAAGRSWPGVGRWRRDRHEQKPGELRRVSFL